MGKIKLLIVDDEPLAHKVWEGYCEKIDYAEIIGNCYDGLSTLNFLHTSRPDAILLDIQMPDLTGFELLDALREKAPKIILTTAFTDYAVQSFEYDQVVDYLHKPVRITRFLKALERLKKVLSLEKEIQQEEPVKPAVLPSESPDDFISLRDSKTVYKIQHGDIQYIQSWGNYIKIFLRNEDMKLIRKTIAETEAELPSSQFLRIHKSYLVNLQHVKSLQGNQLSLGDQYLPVSKSYRIKVQERLG